MDKAHVQFIVPPRAHTLEHEGAKPWIGKPCPVLTASDGLEADPAIFETTVRARRVPGPTPYRRTPVSSMESSASQQLRDTTRVFEVEANTVLHWLIEAAEHLRAFSASFLCALHVKQLQLDELYAVLSAVKDGELTEAKAIKRLTRSPHWVWVALDPLSKAFDNCSYRMTLDVHFISSSPVELWLAYTVEGGTRHVQNSG